MPADATCFASTAPKIPPAKVTPCRVSRFASIALALASLLPTVPSGRPSCRATSLRVLPSRSDKTITSR